MAIRGTSVILVLAMLLAGASASRELQGIDFGAGGSCTAVGVSTQYGHVENLWGEACAGAMKHACSIDGSYDGKKFVDEMEDYFHGYAKATVDVWASALAKCTSYGKYTNGCAQAYAEADKEVQARIVVLAKAWAEAWNNCKRCDPHAEADMFTKLIVKISAQAKVRAHAAVCVRGNDSAFQRSVSECWASVIAKACAHAFAKAVVKGGCAGQAAKAKVLAYVHVHVNDPTCECTYWKKDGSGTMLWTNPPPSVGSCKFHAWAP